MKVKISHSFGINYLNRKFQKLVYKMMKSKAINRILKIKIIMNKNKQNTSKKKLNKKILLLLRDKGHSVSQMMNR